MLLRSNFCFLDNFSWYELYDCIRPAQLSLCFKLSSFSILYQRSFLYSFFQFLLLQFLVRQYVRLGCFIRSSEFHLRSAALLAAWSLLCSCFGAFFCFEAFDDLSMAFHCCVIGIIFCLQLHFTMSKLVLLISSELQK